MAHVPAMANAMPAPSSVLSGGSKGVGFSIQTGTEHVPSCWTFSTAQVSTYSVTGYFFAGSTRRQFLARMLIWMEPKSPGYTASSLGS